MSTDNLSDESKQLLAINQSLASCKNLQEAINAMKRETKDGKIVYDYMSLNDRIKTIIASILHIIEKQHEREQEIIERQQQEEAEEILKAKAEKKAKGGKKSKFHDDKNNF